VRHTYSTASNAQRSITQQLRQDRDLETEEQGSAAFSKKLLS
jgi:hypothetical protein